jgi:streptogramin lyase
VTRFPLTSLPLGNVETLVAGPDGNVWFDYSVYNPNNSSSGLVYRITPDGHVSTVASLPGNIDIRDLTNGPDSTVWYAGVRALGQDFANSPHEGVVGRVDPSGQVTEFVVPNAGDADHITSGWHGDVWFAAGNDDNAPFIGRVAPGGQFTEYAIPNSGAYSVGADTVDRQGTFWAAVSGYDRNYNFTDSIVRVTTSGHVTGHVLPQIHFPASQGGNTAPSIASMTIGPDGQVWATEQVAHAVERFTPSGRFTRFAVFPRRALAAPDQISSGGSNRLFFSLLDIWPNNIPYTTPEHRIGEITASGRVSFIRFPKQLDAHGNDLSVSPVGRLILEPGGYLWIDDGVEIDRLTLPGPHRRGGR